MPTLLRLFFFASLLFTPTFANASDTDLEELVAQAVSKKLYTHKVWKRLLHYYDTGDGVNGLTSYVDGEHFFLADSGKTDSAAELAASIRILLKHPLSTSFDLAGKLNQKHDEKQVSQNMATLNEEQATDPRCRFVEREKWLRDVLELAPSRVPQHCTDYHEWRAQIDAHSVTLVFPASYLNSPSSMFGHTLFRFDPKSMQDDSSLLSYALSYAAHIDENTQSSLSYAYRGFAGGYPGEFNLVPYFRKLQEYGALENRDVWEYQLDLQPREVERILNHAWELKDILFDYFYLRENCAFRLIEMIDLARPSLNLAEQFKYTAIPAETVKAVIDSGVVEKVTYRPSIGSELQYNLSLIDSSLRHWIPKLKDDPALAASPDFLTLDEQVQHTLLLTANLFLTYSSRRNVMNDGMVKRRLGMLREINRFPAGKPAIPPTPIRPDEGHNTSLFSLGIGSLNKEKFSELNYRISYHDLLDNTAGYLRGGEIKLGNLIVRDYQNRGLKIESFDVISLRSLSSWYSIFNSISWEFAAAFKRDLLIESRSLSFNIQGFIGKGVPMGEKYVAYGLVGSSVNVFNSTKQHWLYVNAHAKAGAMQFNSIGTALLELKADFIQRQSPRYVLAFSQNIVLARNHALRFEGELLHFSEDTIENAKISYRYTF